MTNHQITVNASDGFESDVNMGVSAKLKHFYQSAQEEGIPDRFLSLLQRLEEAETNASERVLAVRVVHNGR